MVSRGYLIKEANGVNSIYVKTFLGFLKLGSDNELVNKNEKLQFFLNKENCDKILLLSVKGFCLVIYDSTKTNELGQIHLTISI